MHSTRKPIIQLAAVDSKVPASVLAITQRLLVLSDKDKDVARLLKELAPYLPPEVIRAVVDVTADGRY